MDPSQDPSSVVWKVVTVVMHLMSASILSVCLARRSFFHIGPKQIHPVLQSSQVAFSNEPTLSGNERRPSAGTFDTLRKPMGCIRRLQSDINLSNYTFQTTPARFTTFLTLVTSLLFVICSSIVVTGVGLNSNTIVTVGQDSSLNDPEPTLSCEAVTYLCIFFYGLTKICVYIVLIERVYIVSCAGSKPPRMSTRTYKAGALGILAYIGIVILLVYGRITEVEIVTRPIPNAPTSAMVTGVCTIGLRLYSAVPLIVYETVITIVLTSMFVLPILNSEGHGYKRRLWPCPFIRKLVTLTTPSKDRAKTLQNLTPNPSDTHNPIPLVTHSITASTRTDDDAWLNSDDTQQSHGGTSMWGSELEHQGPQSNELSKLAKRCLLGTLAGITVAFTNISVLAARNGREEGTTCMRWCVADVVINALAIYAVMQGKEDWWWARDANDERPDVSLPPGIWGDTDPGPGVMATMTAARGRPIGGAEEVTDEKSGKRSVSLFEDYNFGGQRSPTIGRPQPEEYFSPLSHPPPSKISPPDSLLSQKMLRKAKCVSLQSGTRHPNSIKMRSFSSPGSFGSHMEKGKRKEEDEWSSRDASSNSITVEGHSALAAPSPFLLDAYPRPPPALEPATSATKRQSNLHSSYPLP